MKKILFIAGLCAANIAQSAPRNLPPIIDKSTGSNGLPYVNATSSSHKMMLEMLGRLNSMEIELQQLHGLVEEQAHEISGFKKRQQNIDTDIDNRLQQLEVTPEANLDSKSFVTPVPLAELEMIPTPVVSDIKPEPKVGEKAAFNRAFSSVKNSEYQQAIRLFKQFLVDYPAGKYSDNAIFWLASVYKVTDDVPRAKVAFQKVFTEYPRSEKAGMAMLKLGDIYYEEHSFIKAKLLYTRVTTQSADTTAAHMATNKLEAIGQTAQ